jgi:hypothetical protein
MGQALRQVQQSSLDLFDARLPKRPYCSNNLALEGLYRLPLAQAMQKMLIQPNTAKLHVALAFDVDRPTAAVDWEFRGLPPPNITVKNPANGHAHLIYLLEAPVPVSDVARIKPILFMAAIQEGIRTALEADRGYSGLIVKNPRHRHWTTVTWTDQPYQLAYLAEYVDLPTPAQMRRRCKAKDYAGLGRNCTLFEIARREAYSLVRDYWRPDGERMFKAAVMDVVTASNQRDIGNPLAVSECRAIAKSIARWVWVRFTPAQFRKQQSVRGKAKGAKKRSEALPVALQMASEGYSQRQIADALEVTQKTVCNWLKSHHDQF